MKKRIIGILILAVALFNIKIVHASVINGTTLPGDVNGDWIIDKKDARMLSRYIVNNDAENDSFYVDNADYTSDSNIKMNDVVKILKENTNGTVVFIPTQGKTVNGDGTEDVYDANESILFRSTDGKLALLDTAQNREVVCDKISSTIHAYAGVSDDEIVDLDYLIISHSHLDHTGCLIHFLENSSRYSDPDRHKINIKNIVIKNESTADKYSSWNNVYSFVNDNKGTANLITTNSLDEGYTITLGSGTDAMKLHLYNLSDVYENEPKCWNGSNLSEGKSIGFNAFNVNSGSNRLIIYDNNDNTIYPYLEKANSAAVSYTNDFKINKFDQNGSRTYFYAFVRSDMQEACDANANSIAVLAEVPIQTNDKKYLYFPSDLENNGYSHVGNYNQVYDVTLTSHGVSYFYKYDNSTQKFIVDNENKLIVDNDKIVQIPREYEISLAIKNKIGADNLDKLILYQASHHGINVDKASIDVLNINRRNMNVVFTRHKTINPLPEDRKHYLARSYYYTLDEVPTEKKYYSSGKDDDGTLQFLIRNSGNADAALRK